MTNVTTPDQGPAVNCPNSDREPASEVSLGPAGEYVCSPPHWPMKRHLTPSDARLLALELLAWARGADEQETFGNRWELLEVLDATISKVRRMLSSEHRPGGADTDRPSSSAVGERRFWAPVDVPSSGDCLCHLGSSRTC